jgi:Mrp family chromosome partitioning ATPase
MSRNFEMLQQAERSGTLFQSPLESPVAPAPQLVPEQAEPVRQEEGLTLKQEGPSAAQEDQSVASGLARPASISGGSPWRLWLRETTDWLGLRSIGRAKGHRGNINYKNISQQEQLKLVERVFLGPDSGSNRVILFSGVDRAEGGARVCAHAARALAARIHGSVCILDADLHSRSLQEHLRVKSAPGLAEAAVQNGPIRHYARLLAFSNLYMMTSGSDATSSPAPLNLDRLRVRFDELRRQFDYVLLNAPSLGTTANIAQFAQLADGVIFVVDANSTRRETAKQFKESLEQLHVRVLGVVMNDRTFPIPESVYRKL